MRPVLAIVAATALAVDVALVAVAVVARVVSAGAPLRSLQGWARWRSSRQGTSRLCSRGLTVKVYAKRRDRRGSRAQRRCDYCSGGC